MASEISAENTLADQQSPLDTILVAVDFSADSRAALLWACDYCLAKTSSIVVLHVVHEPPSEPGFYRSGPQDSLLPMQDLANAKLAEFLKETQELYLKAALATAFTAMTVEGLPASRILEVAKEMGARLIVIGSRGRTGLPHLMLGSVAERVVQLAPQAVVVVKAPKDAPNPGAPEH